MRVVRKVPSTRSGVSQSDQATVAGSLDTERVGAHGSRIEREKSARAARVMRLLDRPGLARCPRPSTRRGYGSSLIN
jgi:hypothetical protein